MHNTVYASRMHAEQSQSLSSGYMPVGATSVWLCFIYTHMHAHTHAHTLPGGPCDLPCLPHPAPVRVKCQLSRAISPRAASPSGPDQNHCTGPARNPCASAPSTTAVHLPPSSEKQRHQPSRESSIFFKRRGRRGPGREETVPVTVIETTRGCARLSPELISRRLASSVSGADQARLWWNMKCCLVSHWQRRCHMQTQEKSMRLSSVSQVPSVIRFEGWVLAALKSKIIFCFSTGFVLVWVGVKLFSHIPLSQLVSMCLWRVDGSRVITVMGSTKPGIQFPHAYTWDTHTHTHTQSHTHTVTHTHTHTHTHTFVYFCLAFSFFQFSNLSGISAYLSTDP